MEDKSLQGIEDFYISLGYRGNKLRNILLKDKEYQKLLKEKKKKLSKKIKVSSLEGGKYVLSTDLDFEILSKIKQLEKSKLSKEDRILVKLIRAQLEDDWRRSLLKTLNKLLGEYGKL